MTAVELRHGGATDVGRVRETNEDALLAEPPVFVVADGMGGHDRGDVASAIVIEEFASLANAGYDPTAGVDAVAGTLLRCQARIGEYDARQRAEGAVDFASGTTVVAALLIEHEGQASWLVANLGDSRIYRFHAGEIEQISTDHSLVQRLLDSGEITAAEARTHPDQHIITRSLGAEGSAEADYFVLPLASAGRLLLCSDGVNAMIDDRRIAGILGGVDSPGDAARELVSAAVEAGGKDNATALVIDVVGLAGVP